MNDATKPGLLSVDDALAHLLAHATPLGESEWVATENALGRVLAVTQISGVTVPPFDNSAMDGYAVSMDYISAPRLRVSQRIAAGSTCQPLETGTAARISPARRYQCIAMRW